jgi:cadmium resistance protein CadD (predicted permease)
MAMLSAVIGTILLILLAAAASRYSISHRTLDRYDRLGVCIFFIVVGIPFAAAGALLIAHYVANPTS